jgi:hypothetical protein
VKQPRRVTPRAYYSQVFSDALFRSKLFPSLSVFAQRSPQFLYLTNVALLCFNFYCLQLRNRSCELRCHSKNVIKSITASFINFTADWQYVLRLAYTLAYSSGSLMMSEPRRPSTGGASLGPPPHRAFSLQTVPTRPYMCEDGHRLEAVPT